MKELPTPTLDLSPASRVQALRQPRTDFKPQPLVGAPAAAGPVAAGIEVSWARHLDEVREAQRLRHSVFAGEMGAILSNAVPGHDVDLFDDFCEHLLVRDTTTRQVIGTYRVLTPAQAKRVGSTYSDTEFDLTRLRNVRERMVELGRSCVHRDHRHGGVIMALWGALAGFMVRSAMWGSMMRDRRDQNTALVFFAVMIVSVLVYLISYLLINALSRYRELGADRGAALITGKPSALATALQKVTGDMASIPTRDLRQMEPVQAFAFAPAFSKGRGGGGFGLESLLSTHPPLQKRLEQLARIANEMGQR